MLVIDQSNAEELLFKDKKLRTLLPDLRAYFDQWHLGYLLPGLRNMGKRAILELLTNLKSHHLEILASYFGTKIEVHTLDYHIVANVTVSAAQPEMSSEISFDQTFLGVAPYRTDKELNLTFWR
jgi:hypothetical protein